MALDCKKPLGRALPASPHHQLRGMHLPLGERAQVLRQAARLLPRHMAAQRSLQGARSVHCRVLVPLGGCLCAALQARPFFAARADMALELQGLALHPQEAWLHRSRTPACIRPEGGDTLPHDLSPPPPRRGAGTAPLRSMAAAGARPGAVGAEEQRPRRQGEDRGSLGARCAQHLAQHGSLSCRRYLQRGWEMSRCCRAGHEGHKAPGLKRPIVPPTVLAKKAVTGGLLHVLK